MMRIIVAMCLVCFLAACGGSKENGKAGGDLKDEMNEDMKASLAMKGGPIPPNHCRIVGTIIAVDESYRGSSEGDPCSKAPCMATVRVDSVIGYGSAFGGTVGVGSEISVKFSYTLGPSQEVFPDQSMSLPGMKMGSRFQADVQSAGEMLAGGGAKYTIGSYEAR